MSALAQVNTDPAISHDFDFLFGSWKSHNTFLNGRLRGSHDWIDFDGTLEAEPLLGGLGNIDRYEAVRNGKTVLGTTLRLFNPKTQEWSLYWADNIRAGILQPPMVAISMAIKGIFLEMRKSTAGKCCAASAGRVPTQTHLNGSKHFLTMEERLGKPIGS